MGIGFKVIDYRITGLIHWHISTLTNLRIITFTNLLIKIVSLAH